MPPVFALLLASLLITGCKSSTTAPVGQGDAALADGAASMQMDVGLDGPPSDVGTDLATAPADGSADAADSGSAPVVGACDRDLSGTWDVIAAWPGRAPNGGIMTISADTFSIDIEGTRLIYGVTGQARGASWTRNGRRVVPITIVNNPRPFDTASLPLALGGSWAFSAGGEQCALNVGAGLINARCQADPSESYVGGTQWPHTFPRPLNGQVYTATRTMVLSSQFGELGGQWVAKPDGQGENCTVTIAGNKLTANCVTQNQLNGRTQLTIAPNCVASGSTNSGYELSARRR